MTTIAYDGKFIVADGRTMQQSVILRDDSNKFYVSSKTGNLFALCGVVPNCQKFADTYEDGVYLDLDLEVSGFMICKETNKIYTVDTSLEKNGKFEFFQFEVTDIKATMGSGKSYALTAMDCGLSAKDAVLKAMLRDCDTGGVVKVYDVAKRKFL